nr:MAG TPA: hypothetical protein [Caudoviricetes sp.]
MKEESKGHLQTYEHGGGHLKYTPSLIARLLRNSPGEVYLKSLLSPSKRLQAILNFLLSVGVEYVQSPTRA